MGCGASAPSAAAVPPDEEAEGDKNANNKKKTQKQKSMKDTVEDTAMMHADAAAVTVVGAAATIVAGVVSSDARHALREVAAAAGSGLLSLGKELPWVAPLAFLIAGVVQAASDVHALKGDAQAFAKNVRSVEGILAEAGEKGTLENAKDACDELKSVMEEGLAHCHRLQTQYFITKLLLSARDTHNFQELSDAMHRQLTVVAAVASVSANARQLGVTDAYIGTIGKSRQTFVSMSSKVDGAVQPRGDGMWWANDVGMCRHVVANGETTVSNGSIAGNAMPDMPNYNLDEIKLMAGAGNEDVGALLGNLGQVMMDPDGQIPHERSIEQAWNPHGGRGPTFGSARSLMGTTVMSATTHYTGVPIKLGGQTVATFCVYDRASHLDDVSVAKVEALAARAQAVLERRVEERAVRGVGPSLSEIVEKGKAAGTRQQHTSSTVPEEEDFAQVKTRRRAAAAAKAAGGGVVDLDEEDFADVALDPDVDVAVMLVTPWCTHCADVKLAWGEAARRQAAPAAGMNGRRRSVMFATYDIQREDPPTPVRNHASIWVSKEVPALVLATGGSGGGDGDGDGGVAPEKFGPCGANDVPRALQWMRDRGVAVVFDPDANADARGLPPPPPSAAVAAAPVHTLPAPTIAAVGGGAVSVVSAEEAERSRRANEVALEGLRRAMVSTSEVVAAWGGACDALASTSPELAAAAARFPEFLERSLAAQSATARDYVALSAEAIDRTSGDVDGDRSRRPPLPPPSGWEEAVKAQQEVNANQARLLRTVAMVQSGGGAGAGGLRALVGELMRVSEGATARHLSDAMESFRVARGVASTKDAAAAAAAANSISAA